VAGADALVFGGAIFSLASCSSGAALDALKFSGALGISAPEGACSTGTSTPTAASVVSCFVVAVAAGRDSK